MRTSDLLGEPAPITIYANHPTKIYICNINIYLKKEQFNHFKSSFETAQTTYLLTVS